MVDPVVDREGNSYERREIETWLASHGTSPITRTPMTIHDLIPNRALRELIEASNGQAQAASTSATSIAIRMPQVEPEINVQQCDNTANISIKFPDIDERPPVNIVCVIDVSGSMANLASIPGNESSGLTILDVVKHAVHTIIKSMEKDDKLALVIFSSIAEIALDLTNMDSNGCSVALTALQSFQPEASTNLWAGLLKALNLLKAGNLNGISSILLFTDGEPNIEPPRGHIPALQRYIDSNGLPGLISTFGFGYSLDSKLLQEISQTGGGQYAFIPDAGLVGTIFVHAIANIMTTALRNCTIAIEDGQMPIGHRLVGTNVEVGTVHYGQPKNVILDLGNSQGTVCVKITGMMPDKSLEKTVEFSARRTTGSDFKDDLWRLKFVQECWNAFQQMPANREQAIAKIKTLAEEIERVPQSEFLKSLLVDIKGQATEAFKSGYYEKWGRHYIPSLLYAHRNQICNNFKDPGVQNYGGTLFKKIRDTADDLFSSLPAPQPSGTRSYNNYGAQSGGSAPVVSMSAYNNSGYVCFHGDCLVALNSGMKKASKLRKGDVLKSGAIVECLVESKVQSIEMVRLDDLIITPWHPVLLSDTEWVFPADLQPAQTINPESIFSVLTAGAPSIKVNGYTCATLGHNLTGPVIGHPFFGTSKVRTSLQELSGWSQGHVVITGVERDENGLIIGLVQ